MGFVVGQLRSEWVEGEGDSFSTFLRPGSFDLCQTQSVTITDPRGGREGGGNTLSKFAEKTTKPAGNYLGLFGARHRSPFRPHLRPRGKCVSAKKKTTSQLLEEKQGLIHLPQLKICLVNTVDKCSGSVQFCSYR